MLERCIDAAGLFPSRQSAFLFLQTSTQAHNDVVDDVGGGTALVAKTAGSVCCNKKTRIRLLLKSLTSFHHLCIHFDYTCTYMYMYMYAQ